MVWTAHNVVADGGSADDADDVRIMRLNRGPARKIGTEPESRPLSAGGGFL